MSCYVLVGCDRASGLEMDTDVLGFANSTYLAEFVRETISVRSVWAGVVFNESALLGGTYQYEIWVRVRRVLCVWVRVVGMWLCVCGVRVGAAVGARSPSRCCA